ncbi:hypothetical protein RI129_005271 [Pyrocoelia pectoralis]|uniref:NADH dehydrogenase [ubiquinone] 1 alpha subcomplex subunit 7 n=1 Tax=Pyrocoelia pectoralis TaxID=417401 RepID=A0AAN7ZLC7_9COLE
MPRVVDIRDVSPLIQKLRNFLGGRKVTLSLRLQKDIASRSPDPPNLPDGPSHLLNKNYYYTRDARREVQPPPVVAPQTVIAASASGKSTCENRNKCVRPGPVHMWD